MTTATPSSAPDAARKFMDKIFDNALEEWKKYGFQDEDLWTSYQEEFSKYSMEEIRDAYHNKLVIVRSYLRTHGVWVLKTKGNIAAQLQEIAVEDEMTPWTEEEINQCRLKEDFNSYAINMLIKTNFGRTPLSSSNQQPYAPSTNAGLPITPATSTSAALPPPAPTGQPISPAPFAFPSQSAPPASFLPAFQSVPASAYGPPTGFYASPAPAPLPFAPTYYNLAGPHPFNPRAGLYNPPPAPVPAGPAFEATPAAIPPGGPSAPVVQTPPPGAAAVLAGANHFRELATLAKLYTDEDRYSGVDDNFLFKLSIFHDICSRSGIPPEARMKALPSMLKGLAKEFYYTNVTSWGLNIPFDQACMAMHNYFEGEEHKRGVLLKWNSTSLRSIMARAENIGKSLDDCLHLLINELRHLQHGLDPEFSSERVIHNKLVLACQDVPACKFACYKPASTLSGFINDLQSSIATHVQTSGAEVLFTDRRYHRHESPRQSDPRRSESRPRYPDRRYTGRSYTPRSSVQAPLISGSARAFAERGGHAKRCFVCKKEGCWSTKHTSEEREQSRKRLFDRFQKRTTQYINGYEGAQEESSSEDDLLDDEMDALILETSPPASPPPPMPAENPHTYLTSFGPVDQPDTMTMHLANRACEHGLTRNLPSRDSDGLDPFAYIATERYSPREFFGIMIDTGASKHSTAGYGQFLAYNKEHPVAVNKAKAGTIKVQFGIGATPSIGSILISTPIGPIEFHVVKADTPFLMSLADMDRLTVYFNNVQNLLVRKKNLPPVPVIRRFGHPWMLWETSLTSYVIDSFNANPCYLTDTELRQLHRRFGHPSASRLSTILERSGHGEDFSRQAMEKLTKFCHQCQKHGKSPGRFKFVLRDDIEFNYSIIVDIMYIDGSPILHVIDEATRFQAARWLQNISARHTWDSLKSCWIDTYLGPPDWIHHDAGKNFVSREFRQFASSMAITTKAVPVEAHWSIGMVERYHAVIRRAYQVITEELQDEGLNKEMALQMAVKSVNDTAGPNGLVPTLLVFGAYPRMHPTDPPAPTVIQRAAAIEKAMAEVRKDRDERLVADALNTRNGPLVFPLHDLPLNSEVLVWREGNAGRRGRWTGPFKLLSISNETCHIDLPSGPTAFRSTCVKPYHSEQAAEEDGQPMAPEDRDQEDHLSGDENPRSPPVAPVSEASPEAETHEEFLPDRPADSPARNHLARERRLPVRFQNIADISIFIQDPIPPAHSKPYVESRQKEINGLLEKGVFEVTTIDAVPPGTRIFNSRFVDEIKHPGTPEAFEKSRLVVQAYNDHEKVMILTQAPTIQRMSQRLILALAATTGHGLHLRDITQAYVQSATALNRRFFVRPPSELGLAGNAILRIIKPLYGVPEAGAHWFHTYHRHHTENLNMAQSSYDSCLLYKNSPEEGFGVVGLQTDDTLLLADEKFAATEEKALQAAKILSKPREALTISQPIKFNGGNIHLKENGNISLTQQNQCKCLRLVALKSPADLTSSRGQIRKAVAPKDQYIAQRARGAYIASVSQLEAAFDLSHAAQVINPKEDDVKTLNKRLNWQMENSARGLNFVRLDRTTLKLVVFTDASFANNLDLSSQIGYVIVLADGSGKANIIHWSSIKCKRITRSVLASELYAMAHGFDAGAVIKSTTEGILNIPHLPLIICTDSKSLYECLVKLGSTQEKRLMIDVMCLRQSYERREITEIEWIDGGTNPADPMTKAKPSRALEMLIDSNTIELNKAGWVERG